MYTYRQFTPSPDYPSSVNSPYRPRKRERERSSNTNPSSHRSSLARTKFHELNLLNYSSRIQTAWRCVTNVRNITNVPCVAVKNSLGICAKFSEVVNIKIVQSCSCRSDASELFARTSVLYTALFPIIPESCRRPHAYTCICIQ